MHQYSIDTKIRDKVVYCLVVVSISLSILLTGCFSGLLERADNALNKIEWLSKLAEILRITELLPNIISAPIIYGLLSLLFNKVLWKTKVLQRFLGVPNFNGIWSGKLHSSYDDNEYTMNLEIEQTWTTIRCTSLFDSSKSYSNVAAVYTKGSEGNTLYFGFHNQSSDIEKGSQQYDGYNILILKGNTLYGKYFNDRPHPKKTNKGGNLGTIELYRNKQTVKEQK